MAVHALSDHFARFFRSLNPGSTFEQRASAEHQAITALIENRAGPAGALEPHCFLQGSYRQDTAIYTINDIDIIALCRAWYPGTPVAGAVEWPRDRLFQAVASSISADSRFTGKVRYGPTNMVIHVDLAIKVEVLPVVYQSGVHDTNHEPFVLYRPEHQQWENGWARTHQQLLTQKNAALTTLGNFKPMIKVLKHLRSLHGIEAVSFHLECLLYALPNLGFFGGPADYITNVLMAIVSTPADTWYGQGVLTPCADRNIFTAEEWMYPNWLAFHAAAQGWLMMAAAATNAQDRATAIRWWQALLGPSFFPSTVTP